MLFNSLIDHLQVLRRGYAIPFQLLLLNALVSGCVTSVGPSRHFVEKASSSPSVSGLPVIDITNPLAQQVSLQQPKGDFATNIGDATPIGTRVGVGDTLEVTIWEAAPAALFGTATSVDPGSGISLQTSRANTLPGIMVGPSGTISIPFAGQIPAAGRTLHQIEDAIVSGLRGRAHLPQVMVRIARNATANVTVLGDVKAPQRVALTPRGERLLDVLAEAGGTTQPLDRMTIELTRGNVVQRMDARDVVREPRENVVMRSDDVVTVLYQPFSFTVMGASGKNEELRFEGVGLSLAQALGRIGGLQDQRADPRGVFLFRWERPGPLGTRAAVLKPNKDGLVPVIYRADMKQPSTYFAAQHFPIHDGDVIYVSDSSTASLQRFVNLLSSSILPIAAVSTVVP